jgi:hypothetical protein
VVTPAHLEYELSLHTPTVSNAGALPSSSCRILLFVMIDGHARVASLTGRQHERHRQTSVTSLRRGGFENAVAPIEDDIAPALSAAAAQRHHAGPRMSSGTTPGAAEGHLSRSSRLRRPRPGDRPPSEDDDASRYQLQLALPLLMVVTGTHERRGEARVVQASEICKPQLSLLQSHPHIAHQLCMCSDSAEC